ncbi:amidohydrolase family protein [Paenibacillus swuensis]|uniref:amidohydrolase family protein n=1 Tax=Paenibacillus swuensis TaxID=1178515 RepID=UPI001E3BE972|nr:amidohydrolase family protein [Paenibacillus swuensis]
MIIKQVRVDRELKDLVLEHGKIKEIAPSGTVMDQSFTSWDAKGLLYLPALTDMHCHLDKHFLGEDWRPLQPFVTLEKQLKFEKEMLASLRHPVQERAMLLAQLLLSQGTTRIRTHVDVDPDIGLSHLEAVLEVKEQLKDRMDIEIVAFPQQGLLRSGSVGVMKEALRRGAQYVGGVDPAGLDLRVEASLQAMFELSAEFNAGVDLHLHDAGHLGLYTIDLVADYTAQGNKQGRVAVSHAYCLGMVSEQEAASTLDAVREAGVTILSSVPTDRPMPSADALARAGVTFRLGTDNINDAWSPYGNGDMLQRASRLAEKSGWVTDEQLISTYALATERSLTPLVGEEASFMLVDALNVQHAMASAPRREAVFSKGHLVYQPMSHTPSTSRLSAASTQEMAR